MLYAQMLKEISKWEKERNLLQLLEPLINMFSSLSIDASYSFFQNLIG